MNRKNPVKPRPTLEDRHAAMDPIRLRDASSASAFSGRSQPLYASAAPPQVHVAEGPRQARSAL